MSIKSLFYSRSSTLVYIVFGILLIFLGFGLGYLMGKETNPAPIVIEKCSAN